MRPQTDTHRLYCNACRINPFTRATWFSFHDSRSRWIGRTLKKVNPGPEPSSKSPPSVDALSWHRRRGEGPGRFQIGIRSGKKSIFASSSSSSSSLDSSISMFRSVASSSESESSSSGLWTGVDERGEIRASNEPATCPLAGAVGGGPEIPALGSSQAAIASSSLGYSCLFAGVGPGRHSQHTRYGTYQQRPVTYMEQRQLRCCWTPHRCSTMRPRRRQHYQCVPERFPYPNTLIRR